jgi:HK97 family phage prohead protease
MSEELLAQSVVSAAERGDRVGFVAAVQRLGSLDEAHDLVRNRACLRMVDRVAVLPDQIALPTIELRSESQNGNDAASDGTTLFGHYTVWDTWYEVDSIYEGNFMETVARGATKKTTREGRDSMRALFQHGADPIAADKPLGPIDELHEDDVGAYYEVSLLRDDDGQVADYIRGILPGLKANLYGASFRFRAMREEFEHDTEPSDYNPDGLPERTLKEMQVMEFGPVTFPANRSATASVRSRQAESAPSKSDAATNGTSAEERRDPRFQNREEWLAWISSS